MKYDSTQKRTGPLAQIEDGFEILGTLRSGTRTFGPGDEAAYAESNPFAADLDRLLASGAVKGYTSGKVKESAPKGAGFVSDLADDFPGRAALVKLEMNAADVDALDRDGLIALKGIGETTADEILTLRAA